VNGHSSCALEHRARAIDNVLSPNVREIRPTRVAGRRGVFRKRRDGVPQSPFMMFGGVPVARVATRTQPPPLASTATRVAAAPATLHAALAPQTRDLVAIDPAIASRIVLLPGRLSLGVPRDQVTVPVAASADVTDTSVFEDAHDASKKFFVMAYRLGEESTTRGQQFAVHMTAKEGAWELSLTLDARAPDAIIQANPGAQPIKQDVALLLRYRQRVNGQPSAIAETAFTAAAVTDGGLRATLAIPSLAKRDEVYHALTDPELNCVVIVRRVIQIAVPVPPVATAPPPPKPTPAPRAPGGVIVSTTRAPMARSTVFRGAVLATSATAAATMQPAAPPTLYRTISRALDLSLPFTFDPALNRSIFEGIGAAVPGASQGLLRKQVSWKGQPYVFYQDDGARNLFYYLPDTFKIARRPIAPHEPILSVRFESADGSKERVSASCTYCAVPVVNRERLVATLPALKALVPDDVLSAAGGIELEPLLPDPSSIVLKLAYPGSTTADGPFAARPQATVDLRAGIVDALTLTLDQFRAAYEALFSTGQLLFSGVVAFDMGGVGEQIPFQLRMHDTAEPFASWTQRVDGADVVVSVTNEIESVLRARSIDAVIARDGDVTVEPLAAAAPFPVDIAPATPAQFRLAGGAGAALTDLDLSDVVSVPDKDAVYELILDPSTPPVYLREVTVKSFKPMFDAPASDPQSQVMAIVVDFESGDSVELSADHLQEIAHVPVSLAGFVLGKPEDLSYRYKVTVVRLSGVTADADWRTGESGSVFPMAQ
jgi:hypothetical protein